MYELSPIAEVILRHQHKFLDKRILIAGNIQDFLMVQLNSKSIRIHTVFFHYLKTLNKMFDIKSVQFGLVPDNDFVFECDTLLYFWLKNKSEVFFQMTNILSILPLGCDVFIVGENYAGIRSAKVMFNTWCSIKKIDSIRHCGLYHGTLLQKPHFNINEHWKSYQIGNTIVKTLPGVFSHNKVDQGSQLLLSTFKKPIHGHLADVGCGSGILAAFLAKNLPEVQVTLIDVHAAALIASRATLEANGLCGEVLAGDVYPNTNNKFDMIISNPPFHDDIKISFRTVKKLINGAINHLKFRGEFRIVANAFLPYAELLNKTFGSYRLLAKNNRFKVYQAFYEKKFFNKIEKKYKMLL